MKQQDPKNQDDLLHHLLDGSDREPETSGLTGSDIERFSRYRECLTDLETHQEKAPADFTSRVMAALPEKPHLPWAHRLRPLWPEKRFWAIPAMGGRPGNVIHHRRHNLFPLPRKHGFNSGGTGFARPVGKAGGVGGDLFRTGRREHFV